MGNDFEFGKFSETDGYAEHVAEVQDRIIIKILNEVEKGIGNGDETVTLTELVDADNVNITKEAILEAKKVYSGFGLPVKVDYFNIQSDGRTTEQGFRIEVDLQPDQPISL